MVIPEAERDGAEPRRSSGSASSGGERLAEAAPGSSTEIRNAFSVDVEDYYQVVAFEKVVSRQRWEEYEPRVERNTLRLLELFAEHDVKATFFVLGWVAKHHPRVVREIQASGHEVASHGWDHRRVTELSPVEFREDIRRTKAVLEDLSGVEVIGYRAPNYSIVEETLWALDIILELGHRYDSSIFPIRHDRYGIPGADRFPWVIREQPEDQLVEFPISTVRLAGMILPFVGGGYLRHFPAWFIHWGMRRLNRRESQPAMVYIHPWEIDPEQPRQPVGKVNTVRHYRNLDLTEKRLERLFREFRFTTVREVLGL